MAKAYQLFEAGEQVTFGTFDHENADIRELDGSKATITSVDVSWDPYGEVDVDTIYGPIERVDPFCFLEARDK